MVYVVLIFVTVLLTVMFLTLFRGTKKEKYKTVSAGSATKMTYAQVSARNLYPLKYNYKNRLVSSSELDFFVVDGDSMSKWGINNDDAVLVLPITNDQRGSIQGSPILVFDIDRSIDDNKDHDHIKYKLRKFIRYIHNIGELNSWIDKMLYNDDIQKKILEKYKLCLQRYNNDNSVLVLSVTVDNNELSFSFHPLRFLYGEVKYIVNSNTVRPQRKMELAYN